MQPRLIVLSGLPGSGKSAVARALAQRLAIVRIELDRIEGPLFEHGMSGDTLGWTGYEILTSLADDNLCLQNSVILDAVTWTRRIRDEWRALAVKHGAVFVPIEVRCSQTTLERRHRARWPDLDQSERSQRARAASENYEPWDQERLILDSDRPLDDLVEESLKFLMSTADA